MRPTLISIIIPIFNVEVYLQKCIDSVIAQTIKDIEIILVNDGSTDKSGEICDKYQTKDSRVKVIHKKNGGQSDARNAGLSIAQGEYIGFVDSDDWIDPNMYQLLLNTITEEKADIVECNYYKVYKNQTIPCGTHLKKEYLQKDEALSRYAQNKAFNGVVIRLYTRGIIEGLKFKKSRFFEDSYFTLDIFLRKPNLAFITNHLYYYLQREGSTLNSKVSSKKAKDFIHLIQYQITSISNTNNDDSLKQKLIERVKVNSISNYCSLSIYLDNQYKKIYQKIFRKHINLSIIQVLKLKEISLQLKLYYILIELKCSGIIKLLKKLYTP